MFVDKREQTLFEFRRNGIILPNQINIFHHIQFQNVLKTQ